MSSATIRPRPPGIVPVMVRVAFLTFLFTLLGFAVSLFFAIIALAILNHTRAGGLSMAMAYRMIALPAAIIIGSSAFVVTLVTEVRSYRRLRAESRSLS